MSKIKYLKTIRLALLVGSVAIPLQSNAATNDKEISNVLERFIENVVKPGYLSFHNETVKLSNQIGALCENASSESLSKARNQFKSAARSWAEIEMARIGPLNQENRFERILFYPDRKSTGLRHTSKIIRSKDQRALDYQTLKKKSVATQGLGALEYVLFGKGSDQLISNQSQFRCRYGQSIANNLNIVSDEVVEAWDDPNGISVFWKNPGPDNPEFRNGREALNGIIGILINNLQVVHDIRLGYFLKDNAEDDRPKRAIYRRSAQTLSSISGNLVSLRKLFIASDISSLLPEGQKSIGNSVLFEFDQAINTASVLDESLEKLLAEPAKRQKLEYLSLTVKNLINRLDTEFAPAAGLASGFSFSDGD